MTGILHLVVPDLPVANRLLAAWRSTREVLIAVVVDVGGLLNWEGLAAGWCQVGQAAGTVVVGTT